DFGDSFGMHIAVAPDDDVIIHYGTVRVENNYLAMFIRNRAPIGRVNRFSRVVLTPRHRTPGRINLNTARTRATEIDTATPHVFNPLLGVPGIMGRYAGTDGFFAQTANLYPRDDEPVAPFDLVAGLAALPGL